MPLWRQVPQPRQPLKHRLFTHASASALDSAILCRPRSGESLALNQGMLGITLPTGDGSEVFVLEGRLAGLWAQEFLRIARVANQSRGNTFDLREVYYVDSRGKDVLRMLRRSGARFVTESTYGKDLCKRLELHRIAASEVQSSRWKSQGDAHPGSGSVPENEAFDRSNIETMHEQRSGNGE